MIIHLHLHQNRNMRQFDISIIGSGIVGLSIAWKFAQEQPGISISILEKENEINLHQTGRNSGVIHSGIYYKQGSYKSKNCIEGYGLMLDFLKAHSIPHKITGKVIVATNENELVALEKLYDNGIACGLNLKYIGNQELKEIQEGLSCKKAVWVSETGLTDYSLVSKKILELLQQTGATIYYNFQAEKIIKTDSGFTIASKDKIISTNLVVNAAGLQCDRVYSLITQKKCPITITPFKGEYYKLKEGSYNAEIPIYPVPNPNFPFLGIHITRMLDGTVKLGPNAVLVLDREAYNNFGFNLKDAFEAFTAKGLYKVIYKYRKTAFQEIMKQTSKRYFSESVQKYWSGFNWDMVNGYTSGIRAQALDKNGIVDDFVYEVSENEIHVLNAPSPAATACFAIARQVYELYINRSHTS